MQNPGSDAGVFCLHRNSERALTRIATSARRPLISALSDLEYEVRRAAGQFAGEKPVALDTADLVIAPCERQFFSPTQKITVSTKVKA